MSSPPTLPPLPDTYTREQVTLIHIQPIGYTDVGHAVDLDVEGAHAFQVWVEVELPAPEKWTHVPSMERHYPLKPEADAYAWALAAKYGVQVELHDAGS